MTTVLPRGSDSRNTNAITEALRATPPHRGFRTRSPEERRDRLAYVGGPDALVWGSSHAGCLEERLQRVRSLPRRFTQGLDRTGVPGEVGVEAWQLHARDLQRACQNLSLPYQPEDEAADDEATVALHRGLFGLVRNADRLDGLDSYDLDLLDMSEDDLRGEAQRVAEVARPGLHMRMTRWPDEPLDSMDYPGDDPLALPVSLADHRRLACPKAQLRALRKRRTLTEAHVAWRMGETGDPRDGKSLWCGERQVERQQQSEAWQRDYLMGRYLELVGSGDADREAVMLNLWKLAENKARAQLGKAYAMALAFQALAEDEGLSFLMLTVTCPGKFSPSEAEGRTSVYDGGSPAQAARHLKDIVWKRMRTRLGKLNLAIGLCVTEAQKTGVPHLHVLLLTDSPEEATHQAIATVADRDYRIEHCGEVEGVTDQALWAGGSRQVDVKAWEDRGAAGEGERGNSSIAGYLLKYITKGWALLDDPEGMDAGELEKAREEATRFRAWRRGANTRTLSWIGLGRGFVGLWDTIFRHDLRPGADAIEDEAYVEAREFMTCAQKLTEESRKHREAGRLDEARDAARESGRDWAGALRLIAKLDPRLKNENPTIEGQPVKWGHTRRVRDAQVPFLDPALDCAGWCREYETEETSQAGFALNGRAHDLGERTERLRTGYGEERKRLSGFVTSQTGEFIPLRWGEWKLGRYAPAQRPDQTAELRDLTRLGTTFEDDRYNGPSWARERSWEGYASDRFLDSEGYPQGPVAYARECQEAAESAQDWLTTVAEARAVRDDACGAFEGSPHLAAVSLNFPRKCQDDPASPPGPSTGGARSRPPAATRPDLGWEIQWQPGRLVLDVPFEIGPDVPSLL